MASQQLTMFITDYQKLSDARDMAAYRALGAISAAICYCRLEQTKEALHVLTSALEQYERVAEKLENYKSKTGAHSYAIQTSH